MRSTATHAAADPAVRLRDRVLEELTAWTAPDTGQAALRETYVALLLTDRDALWRRHAPGHLTAGGLVLSHDASHVLLVLHPRAGAWLPPGGHLEPGDSSLAAAALREVGEETGLVVGAHLEEPDAAPLALDAHPFTCSLGVPTRHLNVSFVIRALPGPGGAPPLPVVSEESDDVRWWPVAALPQPVPPNVRAEVRAAVARLAP